TVGNSFFGTLVWIIVCSGIVLTCSEIPITSDINRAIIGMLVIPNSIVTIKLNNELIKISLLRFFSTTIEYFIQYMLPTINPKKKVPLINPYHSSPTCSASLTNTYKIAAIQTVPAMVSNTSITAIFRNTGVDNKSFQPFLIRFNLPFCISSCWSTLSRKHNKTLDTTNIKLTIQTICCGFVNTKNKLPTNHITV